MYKIIILLAFFFATLPNLLHGQQSTAQQLVDEGVALHDQGDYEEAMAKYREALAIDPGLIQAVYEMSLTSLELKDYEGVEKYSSEVIASDEKKLAIGAYSMKSEALLETDRAVEAIALLQEGLEKYGDDYQLHFNLAINYYKQGESGKALTHVRRAIDFDKSHSGAFLLNAYLLKDNGLWVQRPLFPDVSAPGTRQRAFEECL